MKLATECMHATVFQWFHSLFCVSLVLFMIISISGRPSPFSTSTLVSVKTIKRIIVYYVSNQSALVHSTVTGLWL